VLSPLVLPLIAYESADLFPQDSTLLASLDRYKSNRPLHRGADAAEAGLDRTEALGRSPSHRSGLSKREEYRIWYPKSCRVPFQIGIRTSRRETERWRLLSKALVVSRQRRRVRASVYALRWQSITVISPLEAPGWELRCCRCPLFFSLVTFQSVLESPHARLSGIALPLF